MKITKTDIEKTSLISIGVGLITIGYDQVKDGSVEMGLLLIGIGIICILLGIALGKDEK